MCAHTQANMHVHAHEKWEKKKRKDIDVFKDEEFGHSWGGNLCWRNVTESKG